MPLAHPGHQVDRLPCGADREAATAAVYLVHGEVHGGSGRIVVRFRRRVVYLVDAEAKHLAGAGLDGRHHHFHLARVVRRDGRTRGLHRRRVRIDVHRRVDVEAALIQQLLALFDGLAELLRVEDLLGDVVAEERRVAGRAAPRLRILQFQRVLQRLRLGLVTLLLADVLFLIHQVKHDVALPLGGLLVALHRGVEGRRVLRDCGDGGRLHDVKLVGRGAEVSSRGHFHAVNATAELRDVEIALQNLQF